MRLFTLIVASVALFWDHASAQSYGMADMGIGDDDVSDLIFEEGMQPKEMDADEGLDENEKELRMRACFRTATKRMEADPDMVETSISQMMAQGGQQSGGDMSEEQATNYVVFTMVMSCYSSIGTAQVDTIMSGARLPKTAEEDLFKPGASPPRPTRRQYALLETVVREERLVQSSEAVPFDPLTGMYTIGQTMTIRTKALYALAVIVVTFGGILLLYRRILRFAAPAKEYSSKSLRKLRSAERSLAKKMS